ncbi:MAG: Trp family transcriptional regulator [Candidatus Levyibacteriota bacterium]
MAQVSKYPIHKDVQKRMFEIFKSVIASLKDSQDIDDFLEEFLSPVEKIMLAKRLSIAVLLEKGYRYPSIGNILRVTPPTIASVSISLKYSGKGYKKAVEKILRDEKISEFWQKVEDMLAKIPPSKGSTWSYYRRKHEERKWKNRKAF